MKQVLPTFPVSDEENLFSSELRPFKRQKFAHFLTVPLLSVQNDTNRDLHLTSDKKVKKEIFCKCLLEPYGP